MAWKDTTAGNASENPVLVSTDSTPVKKIISVTAVLDFASTLTAVDSADLTVTVTGAQVGDAVFIGPPAAPTANFYFTGFVSAANTVTLRAHNASAGTVDPASATYRIVVMQF